ncbi:hypothetical protein SLNWT_3629 [Streptomyces albus]|uniref:Uncharacterized protein n=1 Tax=Streptomyces albus (strain ATCC 21838 / DSM 41398 / FERM P-419 / JCM 4703 / NBRC 107858) TaxID=1081613 RepID=A0A0B5EXQ4_STRA4|nr:hypothetical protein SLNWT_3629 [Streptomyces albus]AOU78309.1 hypothetical protein SLNHY_3618 [Streptomyces albus]AYN34060.1 hypothetical protein DUI70_3559 [Streptomyces albus]
MTFFTPDTTYLYRPDGYKAPEQWRYFRCAAVVTMPGTSARIAFGFIKDGSPMSGWTPTGLMDADWARGWKSLPDEPPSTATR